MIDDHEYQIEHRAACGDGRALTCLSFGVGVPDDVDREPLPTFGTWGERRWADDSLRGAVRL